MTCPGDFKLVLIKHPLIKSVMIYVFNGEDITLCSNMCSCWRVLWFSENFGINSNQT